MKRLEEIKNFVLEWAKKFCVVPKVDFVYDEVDDELTDIILNTGYKSVSFYLLERLVKPFRDWKFKVYIESDKEGYITLRITYF